MLAWATFAPYALSDVWVLLAGTAAESVALPTIVTTPDRFIPLVLIALLGLYLCLMRLLLQRLRG